MAGAGALAIQATQPAPAEEHTLRLAGSHDPVLSWLAAHFPEILPKFTLQLGFNGSLGGLIALVQGKADLAGCHLWDEESDSYNEPFVRRLLPGKKVALLTLAHRRLGLIVPKGSACGGIAGFSHPGLRFVNRQAGRNECGWMQPCIRGDIWRADPGLRRGTSDPLASCCWGGRGQVDVGFGLEAVALSLAWISLFLVRERYDLVIPAANLAGDQSSGWQAGWRVRKPSGRFPFLGAMIQMRLASSCG
jgi:putative molybdopterin biosynthesis protein